jgi:hypothetical protein
VRSDAKASSAGSTTGQGTSSGSTVRGAFAIRGGFGGADGGDARSRGRARSRQLVTLCLAITGLLALSVSSASAAQTRAATGVSFGPDGVGGSGAFESIQAVATNPSTGAIYVLDAGGATEGGRLYKFTSSGAPSEFSGLGRTYLKEVGPTASPEERAENQIAIAPAGAPGGTAGDIYVAVNSVVRVYSPAGLPIGEISGDEEAGHEACGVATDPSGHVFVGFYRDGGGLVREYTPTANPAKNADQTGQSVKTLDGTCNVATDGGGHVYASRFNGSQTQYLSSLNAGPVSLKPGGSSLAVDPLTDEIYLDTGSSVLIRKAAGGEPNGHFGSAGLGESRGIAIGPDRESVYVANGATGKVEVYGPPLAVPNVEAGEANSLTETTAVLTGTINAEGGPAATCHFEYVSEASFEVSRFETATDVPCAQAGPFEGSANEAVSAPISGLTRVTTYVYRLVGTNSNGSIESPTNAFTTAPSPFGPSPTFDPCPSNEIFRTGPSANLPDCRAYEQASPVSKNGGGVGGFQNSVQASETGGGITFYSQAGIPGAVGGQDYATYLASRGAGSWSTQGLLPPQDLGESAGVLGMTPGNRYAVTEATKEGKVAVFARDLSDGSMTMVVPYQSPSGCIGTGNICFPLAGASTDGSKIFLESRIPLTEETPRGQPNLYVWDRGSGDISLVDVGVNGEHLPEGGFAGAYDWSNFDRRSGGAGTKLYVGAIHAVSRSGDQVVFTERGEEESLSQLYVRRGLNGPSPSTILVSASKKSSPGGPRPAAFLEATPDGRYVFFKSKAELTDDANNGVEEEGWSLYRYDVNTDSLLDLTPDPTEEHENGPGVLGMLGAGESGDPAYFTASAALTAQAGPGGKTPVPGEANLYRFETGANPPLSFVAALQNGNPESYSENDTSNWSPLTERNGTNHEKTARVSADGQTVVFASHNSLTGNPNLTPGCTTGLGGIGGDHLEPCSEFFRYSVQTGALDCVSCTPTGARPLAGATIGNSFVNAADKPSVEPAAVLTRNLSADGNRFFFQTPDALVGSDINGKSGCTLTSGIVLSCLDVYEWEATGTGSCTEAVVNGGCVYLTSSGTSDQPSLFADADREGENVFFFTESQLVPADRDQIYDVYDATVGGGLASQHQTPSTPCVSQSACQGLVDGPEAATTPGSSTFSGPGNKKSSGTKKKAKCSKSHKKCKKTHKKKSHKKKRAGRGQGGAK